MKKKKSVPKKISRKYPKRDAFLILTLLIVVAVGVVYIFIDNARSTGRVVSASCFDSDGGKNYEIPGSVSYSIRSMSYASRDFCLGNFVYERFCNPNTSVADTVRYMCPGGCKGGACKSDLDINQSYCGNGVCSSLENCTSCPSDCGSCILCIQESQSLGAVIPNNTVGCCAGLSRIATMVKTGSSCAILVGGRGYCTKCGDYVCRSPENECNCPVDCKVKTCVGESAFCGGIAGIQCCSSYMCQKSGNYPDAGGKCVKLAPTLCQWCGTNCIAFKPGIACIAIAPPTGYKCESVDGVCTKVPKPLAL